MKPKRKTPSAVLCISCKLKFENEKILRQHLLRCGGKDCQFCPKKFVDIQGLLDHLKGMQTLSNALTVSTPRRYYCTECRFVF